MNRYPLAISIFLIIATALAFSGEPRPAVGAWSFNGDLIDRSGRGNDAFTATAPSFCSAHAGQGLQCSGVAAVVPDTPELRLASGLRIECWVKIDALTKSWQDIVMKNGAYQLRVDPPDEGGRFSFFVDLNGWEPRVSSNIVPKLGAWYHLEAGWDGKEIWIEVDGKRSARPRAGTPEPSGEPLELGKIQGVLDELRIENPNARYTGAAQWLFEGDLRDSSGHGLDLVGKDATFAPVPGGQALKLNAQRLQVADHPELQLAPGFHLDCSVFFDPLPAEGQMILIKDGEYQLRVDPAKEGGYFAFFANLGGWEPRIRSEVKAEPGRWYRLSARWDGFALTLDVNGKRERLTRSGLPKPTQNPLVIGGLRGMIDNVRIENPKLPTLQVRAARQEHAILCAGRPEKFTTSIRNVGTSASQVNVRFKLPPDVRFVTEPAHDLGAMATGAEKTIEWSVQAIAPAVGAAMIEVNATGAPPLKARHPLVIFASEAGLPASASDRISSTKGTVYYIDSIDGSNANTGTSPEAAWKDFAKINNRTLGPGEKLLIKRGSVLNQELTLTAKGAEDNWAEIGAYGSGPRPIIRRNWDIGDRCALVLNPDFLRIRSLVVCHAGKGLVVHYSESGHRGLVIEDCIAHHIEGLYRHNSHGIPEWLDRNGAEGDGLHTSAGLAVSGHLATGLVLRDCDTFQNSSGYFMQGNDVLVDRVFCHDNISHNTSPHPFLVSVYRSVLRNSIFDASGWHASAGTMGIMLGNPQGLIIRNCFFRNQPDSKSHDEGGIDFENSGNGCLIDRCTFENNAGAAIEMLGLKAPQTTNVEIRGSKFIRNNTAKKLGPSEIYIWGKVRDPSVCCSTGLIQGNGYVTLPGIDFLVNEAPQFTSWTVRDNTGYPTVAEIDRAMPLNRTPVVDAGPDIRTDKLEVRLSGSAKDDGKPADKKLSTLWEILDGPGTVTFEDAANLTTLARFRTCGDYTLRLRADDGELWLSDRVVVHVLPASTTVAKAWEFNTNLDKEGWTEVNPGTQDRLWQNADWPTTSNPVKLVTGGYYILAIENSPNAQLLSPDQIGLALTGRERVTLRFQNHTPAEQMRLRFITDLDGAWDDKKSAAVEVKPNDDESRTYTLDMSAVPAWKGHLRQFRLDLASGKPLTGTCRFDFVWISTTAR